MQQVCGADMHIDCISLNGTGPQNVLGEDTVYIYVYTFIYIYIPEYNIIYIYLLILRCDEYTYIFVIYMHFSGKYIIYVPKDLANFHMLVDSTVIKDLNIMLY